MRKTTRKLSKEELCRLHEKECLESLNTAIKAVDKWLANYAREEIRKESLKTWGALRKNRNMRYDERGKTWRPIIKNVPKTI